MDERLRRAVERFSRQQWYTCHDELEELWHEEQGPVRDVYKGVLQIAVAFYHEGRANRRGARRLLDSGMQLVEPFAPRALGLELADLLAQLAPFHNHLQADTATVYNGPWPVLKTLAT